MNGNICPRCGKAVMSYKRFFREAEPSKISQCDNCGSNLRRSRNVYLYLLLMIVIFCMIVLPVFVLLVNARTSFWIIYPSIIIIGAVWVGVINYLGWRLIGWVLVAEGGKS